MTSEEYYNWLSKFEAKKTTDDCYTPPSVYDAMIEYVDKEVISLDGLNVVRPFYPDGDYQKDAQNYDDKTIVIDNPPFSIITPICKFYQENNIKFFLFAPGLTALSIVAAVQGLTVVIAPKTLVYSNGASVNSAFITNLMPSVQLKTAPTLSKNIELAQKANKSTKTLPKYQYPKNILTINAMQKLANAGLDFEILASHCQPVRALDEQKAHAKAIFGAGLLICDDKAKELQAKELQAKELQAEELQAEEDVQYWTLSERERAIVESLGV